MFQQTFKLDVLIKSNKTLCRLFSNNFKLNVLLIKILINRLGPLSLPSSEASAQSRPQLNSSIMNRMSSLLSRMLNDNNSRHQRNQQNRTSSENRIAEGIQMLFSGDQDGENEAGGSGMNNNILPSTSHDDTTTSSSSSSSSNYSSGDEEIEFVKFNYVKQKFVGHRNARTMIKEANFWGDDFVSKLYLTNSNVKYNFKNI